VPRIGTIGRAHTGRTERPLLYKPSDQHNRPIRAMGAAALPAANQDADDLALV
jgi:hypothetical protein